MRLSFRHRILLTLIPLLVLLAGLGITATVLLYRLGGEIDLILRENYRSVRYMQHLRELLEDIDTSFQLALAGQGDKEARKGYEPAWKIVDDNVRLELNNITILGEQQAADSLAALAGDYRKQGEKFWDHPARSRERQTVYFQRGGLRDTYEKVRDASQQILEMNQANMEEAEETARATAQRSLVGFAFGLALVAVAALWLAVHTIRATIRPVQMVTQSALAIGRGNLDQVIPVTHPDELGQLAEAFNTMARQLREYRQSDYARLLRAQQTSQATIDSFPDPVVVVDSGGQVEMANPAAQHILGVVNRSPLPGDLAPLVQRAIREQTAHIPETFDRVIRLIVQGEERFFLPNVLPIAAPTGQTLGAALLLQDVTRFRLLDQVKSDLVATVSHELKTPLTSIRLALHLLLEEAIGPLTPKQAELLIDARDNGERLLRMVNNLLDLARLEKGKAPMDLRPERPGLLVDAALDPIRPRAADKGVNLVVQVPESTPAVAVDSQRLGHALGNLLDNALTYTPSGGSITVSATTDDDTVTLTVADTGVGIPPEHVPHIFDKFYRIPGQSKESGSGLGLAIVREVVLAHGGTVECDSTPGQGTVFRIALPVWKGEGS